MPELQPVCASWNCHDKVADHEHPSCDTMPGRRQTNNGWPYQSSVTAFPSSSSLASTWSDFAKKKKTQTNKQNKNKQTNKQTKKNKKQNPHAVIRLAALLFRLNSRWVLIWEDPQCRLLLRLGVVLVFPGYVSCYDV